MQRIIPVALLLLSASTVTASAQAATYRRNPGDTLRYQTTMSMTTDVEGGPTGPMQVAVTGQTSMAFAFAAADTVRFWIEKGSMKMSSPMGEMSPPIDAMLNKVWVARLSANGKFEVLSMPALTGPGGHDILAGVAGQNAQFFAVLPAEPLSVGLSWPDSVETRMKMPTGGETIARTTSRYTVAKDSTMEGDRVFIIEKTGKTTMEANVTMDAGGTTMYMKMNMAGDVTGRIYFAPDKGVILKQTDLALTKGTQQVEGPMSMSTNNTQRMENTMVLVR